MAHKPYSPMSPFWWVFIPGVVLGVCYWVWNDPGFVSMQFRGVLQPFVNFVNWMLQGLI